MKRIGVIGGMSAESTALYYASLNAAARARLGGLHGADLVIRSLDFAPIAALQAEGRWADAGAILAQAARDLEAAGAELLLIAANTMHKVVDAVQDATVLPLIHIADPTGEAIRAAGLKRPGLIATRFTMEEAFYTDRLRARFGLDPLVPEAQERLDVHRIIYEELCVGRVLDASRRRYEAVAASLLARGADCIVFGCTEVGLILSAETVAAPVFDTAALHVEAAIEAALAHEAQGGGLGQAA